MQSDDCPDGVLDEILTRIHLKELGSVKRYRELADLVNLKEVQVQEMPEQLVNHYGRVREVLMERQKELQKRVGSEEHLENMASGLNNWVEGGHKGYLNLGHPALQKVRTTASSLL
ncbi:MAG: hypothetical protein U5L96_05130 [Owenweeksia sp.]|nr:hypothetical protein [Owenweeksia sp.]